MKARIKQTGEVAEVKCHGTIKVCCTTYITPDGIVLPSTALELITDINWEQRRYEIAKDYFVHNALEASSANEATEFAVAMADKLIEKLKSE